MKRTTYLLFLAMLMAACHPKPYNPPAAATAYASEFTSGVEKMHGAYYQEGGLDNQVVSLDLYSKGLSLNKFGRIEGTGTNLFFSDIFLVPTDSVLQPGQYLPATDGTPNTFLPGKNYEGNFTGAYLLLIEDAKLMSYTLLPEGELNVETDGDSTFVTFVGKTQSGKKYEASYRGKLKIQDAR